MNLLLFFCPWGHSGHFVRLPFHLELLAAGARPRGSWSRHGCKSVWKWTGRLQGRAGPGPATLSSLDSSLVNIRKLVCYQYLIVTYHKTSDVLWISHCLFLPVSGQFVFGSHPSFCIHCLLAPKGLCISVYLCNQHFWWPVSFMAFTIAFA